jgi:hypothetical protein
MVPKATGPTRADDRDGERGRTTRVRKESENIFTFKGKESREISLGNYSRITTLIQHSIHLEIIFVKHLSFGIKRAGREDSLVRWQI